MIYRFGDVSLDTARRELCLGGATVAIEPQVFDLLQCLIERRDRVVSRDDLLTIVWRGRIVSEATLSSRVNAARAAIGDNGTEQRLIRTLPRKGFRFVAEVRETLGGETYVPTSVTPPPLIVWQSGVSLPSLAVLPFTNMVRDSAQDYFAKGMAEEIITALSRSSGLLIIASNSSFTYGDDTIDIRQVGHQLGVDYVLTGSVRRGRERFRIAAHLIDAKSGAHLWSDRFEGDPRDIFELQDRVAECVTAVIEPTLQLAEITRLQRNPPAQLDAYDLLLRAYALISDFTKTSMEAALDCLEQSLAIDPNYAPAMAAAAYCRAQCHFQGWMEQDAATKAGAVARAWRAVELAPNDSRVLWMAAFAIWNMALSGRERARDLFNRSLLHNPHSAMALTLAGWIETMAGNHTAGREMIARAYHLNPRDPRSWLMFGVMAISAVVDRNHADAVKWADRALAQNRRFAVALRVLAVACVELGQMDRARKAVRELLKVEPHLTVTGFFARIPMPVEALAKTYANALEAAGLPP